MLEGEERPVEGPEAGLCTGSSTFHHFWQNEQTKAQHFLVFFSNRLNSAFPRWRVRVAPEEPGQASTVSRLSAPFSRPLQPPQPPACADCLLCGLRACGAGLGLA